MHLSILVPILHHMSTTRHSKPGLPQKIQEVVLVWCVEYIVAVEFRVMLSCKVETLVAQYHDTACIMHLENERRITAMSRDRGNPRFRVLSWYQQLNLLVCALMRLAGRVVLRRIYPHENVA